MAEAFEGTYEPETRRTTSVSSDKDGFSYHTEGQYSEDYRFHSERMTRSHSNWTDPRVLFMESRLLDPSPAGLEQPAVDSGAAPSGELEDANPKPQPAADESNESVDPRASAGKVAP